MKNSKFTYLGVFANKSPIVLLTFIVTYLTLLLTSVNSYDDESSPYKRSEFLDRQRKYMLEWEVNWIAKDVTFNVTVKTTGYIGFGLSKRGKMSGADIVIGGVLDGNPYFSDRHAIANQLPVEDESQDWALHKAWENGTHTFLSFSRPFDTCDEDHDLLINEDALTLIWAFGEKDDVIEYHFQNRGRFYVYLLDPDLTPKRVHDAASNNEKLSKLGNWNVWTISEKQTLIAQDTSYLCTFYKAPRHNRKQHIVGFRTILESDLERRHIHHYLLHRCYPPPGQDARSFFDQYVNRPAEECYILSLPSRIPTEYCQEVTHVWAVGATPIFFPDHVGVPLSESPDEYYMFQVHYDNPSLNSGIELNFSLEMYYTENLRKHDAGIIFLGIGTPGSSTIMVPSNSINHVVYGHCGGACTQKMFPPEGIQVFASKLHTHLAGVGARFLHIRNNTELPHLLIDDNYIFDYQPTKILQQERTILPGDLILKRCLYDTRDKNGSATIGGFSTLNEMCNGYIWYYPYIRSKVYTSCSSEIRSNEYNDFLQIWNTTWSDELRENVVTSPPQNAGLPTGVVGNRINWTIKKRNQLQNYHKYLPHLVSCDDVGPDAVEQAASNSRPNLSPSNDEFISTYFEDNVIPYERISYCHKH